MTDNIVISIEFAAFKIDEQELTIHEWGKPAARELIITKKIVKLDSIKENTNSIKVESGTNRRFVIGAGKAFGLPWVKLLGNDGTLLGPNAEFIRNTMKEFESNK